MSNSKRSDELHELLAELSESNVSEAQWLRMRQLLAADEEARRAYRRVLMAESLLERFQVELDAPSSHPPAAETAPPRPAIISRLVERVREVFSRPTPISVTVAALVVAALVGSMALMAPPLQQALTRNSPPEEAAQLQVVARLTGVHKAAWADDQGEMPLGETLRADRRLKLLRGLAEVTFRDGAIVTLEGPCQFTLASPSAGTLQEGKLSAWVGERARGFSISTPSANVVDLGTEFGVQVEGDGDAVVQVFRGAVQLESAHGGAQHRLTSGMLARATAGGQIQVDRQALRPDFVRHLPAFDNEASGETIAYIVARGAPGRQDFAGSLGMDFMVHRAIEVTRLGVYDNGGDGLRRTITAELWRRDDTAGPQEPNEKHGPRKIAALQFTPNDAGQLAGSSRFKLLDEPLVLEPGNYTIVAHGYGPEELVSNEGGHPEARRFKSRTSGGNAIQFVPMSRFGEAGEFPAIPDGGANPQRYAAGTFAFRVCPDKPKALHNSSTERGE